MSFTIAVGLVGIGAEIIWPLLTIRFLLLSLSVTVGDTLPSYQRALASHRDALGNTTGWVAGTLLATALWVLLGLLVWVVL